MGITARHKAGEGTAGKSVEKLEESKGLPMAAACDAALKAVVGRLPTAN